VNETMTTDPLTFVVIDAGSEPGALLAAAKHLGVDAEALVIGPRALADQVSAFTPAKTRWLGEPTATVAVEDYAEVLVKLAEQEAPAAVLISASTRGRLLAGRLAARLDTAAVTDVTHLGLDDGAISATHPLYGGVAVRTERLLSPIAVIVVSASAFSAESAAASVPGEVTEALCSVADPLTAVLERRPEPRSAGEVTSAKVVVGAGRGVGQQENLALVETLAHTMGGEMACTRPLAEGLNWMPRDRYLGVSGLDISPELYLAVGISGQSQHMVGVDRARVIVAINTDKAAPVFAQCDYGIVGDLTKVLPALISALEQIP